MTNTPVQSHPPGTGVHPNLSCGEQETKLSSQVVAKKPESRKVLTTRMAMSLWILAQSDLLAEKASVAQPEGNLEKL